MKFDRDNLYNGFPITDYYKENIVDAVTIKRGGGWWTALLLIKDPKSEKLMVNFYKWQLTDNGWKIRSRFKINSKKDCESIKDVLIKYSDELT